MRIAMSVKPTPEDFEDILGNHKKFYAIDADEFIVTPAPGDMLEFHASGNRKIYRVITHVETAAMRRPNMMEDEGRYAGFYLLSMRPLGKAEKSELLK